MTVEQWLRTDPAGCELGEAHQRLRWPGDWWGVQVDIHVRRFVQGPDSGPWTLEWVPVGAIYHYCLHLLRLGGFTNALEILVRDLVAAGCRWVVATVEVVREVVLLRDVTPIRTRDDP